MNEHLWNMVIFVGFLPFLVYFFYKDMKEQTIPNVGICWGFVAAFLLAIFRCLVEQSFFPLLNCLIDAVISALPLFFVIVLTKGGMGAGDMKLLGLMGAWFGVKVSFVSLLFGIGLAGIFALLMLLFGVLKSKAKIPFAPFLLLGLVAVFCFQETIFLFLWVYYGIG